MTRPSESGARRAARRRVAIPVFTIVAILLTPITEGVGAQAAGETCRGREATIVGGPCEAPVAPLRQALQAS